MPLQKIVDRIMAEAAVRAERLREEGRAKSEELLSAARQRAAARREAVLEKARAEAAERKRRIVTLAVLEIRRDVLAVKRQAIDEVFRAVLERLGGLPDEEYRELLRRMLRRSVETGEEEIIVSPRDRGRINEDFLASVNAELRERGLPGKLRLSASTREMRGGFVLHRENLEVNCSFDTVLGMMRDSVEPDIVRLLFAEDRTQG